MKLLAFLILTTLLAISSSKPGKKLVPSVAIDCPLIPITKHSQTILFDVDVNSDPSIRTCILKSVSEQSVLILTDYDRRPEVNFTNKRIMTNEFPNVIITTNHLSFKAVRCNKSPLLELFMKSNWSWLYIIVTGDSVFSCKNGTMTSKHFRLLEKFMNTIWHRFEVMRVGLAFPIACKQKMIIYHRKRPSTQKLYDRSIKLINATSYKDLLAAINYSGTGLCAHYPIKANIFERYPTSITQCKNLHYYDIHFNLNLTFGYCGLDGMVMHDLLTHFRFNLSSPKNEDCNIYGFAIPGNISGSLGCIVRNELDLSFNSRFMTLYSDEHIYYLHYITTDKLCALVRKTGVVPLWHGPYNVFRPPLWFIIMGVLVLISGIMWVYAIINRTITGQKVMAYWYYLLNAVMTTMIGCSPMKNRSMIIIRSACLSGSILFLAVYQGHTSRVYTTLKHFERISTLDDLYAFGAILYTTPGMRQFTRQLQRPGNKLEEDFFNRSRLILNERIGITLEIPRATTLDRKSDAEMKILEHFSDREGRPLIDIVDECFMNYFLSYITRSGFPFFEEIQIFTQRLLEAGLPTKYYKWTQQMLNIPTSLPETRSEPRPFSKIKLKDQRVAFFVLFVGSALSIIVFAVEIFKGPPVEF
ncbi:hypothetical protein B5X24_HaOG200912 [Helicoverpa armigera]|uniref:Ionotropic glutamate receptor C-terminal domain-containing protein n=1 Tax=Helicoverpa armigera TaxID=29058 RepID=A0A2W1BJW3_HELAM|nr:hypothetical protein B5X24_HaOG200912 [Helicoverpa armigera]